MRVMLVVWLAACGAPMQSGDQVDASSGGGDDGGNEIADAPPQSATCTGKMGQPLDATWTITVGSTTRTAKVHVPASYDPNKRTPLVVDIHGRTQNASGEMTLTHSIAKSDSAGFIAIYPESITTPTAWNSGTCCEPANTLNVDDTGFFRKLLDEAEAKLCIDTSRIYMMGMSNGGYQSHRMACELSDRVAAVGPVAGLLLFQGCAPTRAMPVMMVNGTSDSLTLYQYTDESVDFWRAKNKCTTMATTYQNGAATCVTHGGCTNGADVVLCTINGGGHQWPGGTEIPFLGTKSDDLMTTDALWDFFVAHPLGAQ